MDTFKHDDLRTSLRVEELKQNARSSVDLGAKTKTKREER